MSPKKKDLIQPSEFDGIFTPPEEEDIAKVDDDIMINNEELTQIYQDKFVKEINEFHKFIDNPLFITKNGDKNTNIVDRFTKNENNEICAKTYNIPEKHIPWMFKLLDLCRRQNLLMMVYERQMEYSGFMIDFDIYQSTKTDYLKPETIKAIVRIILDSIIKYINLAKPNASYDNKNVDSDGKVIFTIYVAVTKKPEVKFIKDKNCYKNGMHILIPGIKITREVKRFILRNFIQEDVFNHIFKRHNVAAEYTTAMFVDKDSAHVPVYFLGSSTKLNSPAYNLAHILKTDIYIEDIEQDNVTISEIEDCMNLFEIDNKRTQIVLVHELSINWESNIIKKYEYDIKESYIGAINITNKELGDIPNDNNEQEYGELSSLNLHDPEAKHIENLLNTLNIKRSIDFNLWFRVLCVLAHTSKSYKPLAEKFSMKCPEKFNKQKFEQIWEQASIQTEKKLTIATLYHWARLDNPTEYERVMNLSLLRKVNQRIHAEYKEGDLNHHDVAKILYECQQNKYVCDDGIWYEFILEGEPTSIDGEVCKWRRNTTKGAPYSLEIYISEILPVILQKVLNSISNKIDNSAGDSKLPYLLLVKNNLKSVYKQLGNSPFNAGVARAAERVFSRRGFINNLDTDKDIMGVGNGILKLGNKIEFINGFHPYNISLSTNVKYKPFDPFNPKTKALLIAIRNLFPDDEPDSFEFFMCYVAKTLDGHIKESLLLMLVGAGSNGKTFIMNLVKETLGMYGVKMPLSFLTSRSKDSESATPSLMSLRNARLAFYSETSRTEVLNLPKIKEITGQETLSGRMLYGHQLNFKPVCHHIVTSNYDFEIDSTDHGTWRRLRKLRMKIKFCKPNVDNYNEKDPHEREANPDFNAAWLDDPEIKSGFLSILCYYYMLLKNKYKGMVENVPHPHIKKETEIFRNREDKINHFISTRIVKLPKVTQSTKKDNDSESDDELVMVDNDDEKITMTILIERYIHWHKGLYGEVKEQGKHLISQFQNSRLGEYIKDNKIESYLIGFRFVNSDNILNKGEILFMDLIMNDKKTKKPIKVKKESSEQYYNRICDEYNKEVKRAEKELERKNKTELAKVKTNINNLSDNKPSSYKTSSKTLVLNEYDKSGIRILKQTDSTNCKEYAASSDEDESDNECEESNNSDNSSDKSDKSSNESNNSDEDSDDD
jgi:hypothetical protein